MDLLTKVAAAVVVLIVIASLGFLVYNAIASHSSVLTSQQASQIVLSDLKLHNPNANITIINITPSTLKSGSWSIILSIIYNATRACPTLSISSFDYPATGLVPTAVNIYSYYNRSPIDRCTVPSYVTTPETATYVTSSPEIAIVKSYKSGFTPIVDYVRAYGYNNTAVYAKFFNTLEKNMTPINETFYNVWLVNYTANGAIYSQFVILNSSGSITGNYTG